MKATGRNRWDRKLLMCRRAHKNATSRTCGEQCHARLIGQMILAALGHFTILIEECLRGVPVLNALQFNHCVNTIGSRTGTA